jgi:hypothetical protein
LIPDFRWPDPEDGPDEKIISDVREYGVHILNVFADDAGPGWSFSTPFPCVQLVWPDKGNHFPWEDGYDKNYLDLQPILGPPQ